MQSGLNTITQFTHNTRANTDVVMINDSEIERTNILHIQNCNLSTYGAKTFKVAGPVLWNELPDQTRNAKSRFSFKNSLKNNIINKYLPPIIPAEELLYISNLSICCMRITISRMEIFEVPPYLLSCLRVKSISNDGLKIKIFRS